MTFLGLPFSKHFREQSVSDDPSINQSAIGCRAKACSMSVINWNLEVQFVDSKL